MFRTQSNFPIMTRPQTTSPHLQATSTSSSSIPIKQKMYKPITISVSDAEKKAACNPVEIGTRGTVGSLLMREIEYFSRLELSGRGNSRKLQKNVAEVASSSSQFRPTIGSISATQKKKKRGGTRLLPSLCSMVEVSDSKRPIGFPGFGYKNLKTDIVTQL